MYSLFCLNKRDDLFCRYRLRLFAFIFWGAQSFTLLGILPVVAEELDDLRIAKHSAAQLLDEVGGTKISLDLNDVPVREALSLLGQAMHKSVVIHREIVGSIKQLKVVNVSAEQVFKMILRNHRCHAVTDGNVILVYPIEWYLNDLSKRKRLDLP